MAGQNLSPRQKMIGLMYLVLLAMLAMNASKDLLNAFIYIENGIELTADNFSTANQNYVNKIAYAASTGSQKGKENLNIAQKLMQKSNALVNEIDGYKKEIINLGGGLDEQGIPIGKDNQDVGAQFLLFQKHGKELKNNLQQFKTELLKHIDVKDENLRKSIARLLDTPDHIDYEGNKIPWENALAEHLPLVAVTANLTNIQTYIRNTTAQTLNYLQEQISMDSYKVNKIMANVNTEKSYLLEGDTFTANIFLAAADTTQEPIILVGDYDEDLWEQKGEVKFLTPVDTLNVKQGVGKYQIQQNQLGAHEWKGFMFVPHPNPKKQGSFLKYPFKNSYTVAKSSAVISAKNLQVMYMGIQNEVEISASGIQKEFIQLKANNATVQSDGNGNFKVRPKRLGKINLRVYNSENNKGQLLSTQNWTSKRLPEPEIALLGNKIEKAISNKMLQIPNNQKFTAIYPKTFPINDPPKMKTCVVNIKRGNEYEAPYKLKHGIFNHKFQSRVKQLKRGDILEIEATIRTHDNVSHDVIEIIKIK